jgi:ribonuclease HII
MAIVAGIDEAGFGPLLGPMVVSANSFYVPDEIVYDDLWGRLKQSVSKTRKNLRGRILIADSKKAYSKTKGLKDLERAVFSCIKCLGHEKNKLSELFGYLCPDCLERLEAYPWYEGKLDSQITKSHTDTAIAANMLRRDMQSSGMKFLGIKSNCLDVGYYNRLVGKVGNKSRVLFTVTSQLLSDIWQNSEGERVEVVIDRQGGRVRYGRHIQRMFPDTELRIIKENKEYSSYEITGKDFHSRVHFVVKADDRSLPVSLASMTSKYLRELLVGHINDYFTSQCDGLKPTAGYWQDGKRFISDLNKFSDKISYDKDKLIRIL